MTPIWVRRSAMGAATVALSTLLALVLLELVLRVVKINTLSHIVVVPGRGVINTPHGYYVHSKEGFSEGRFNAHGFRDFERSLEKPAGVYRIAVFGDSFIEGFQVDLSRTFCSILERELKRRSGGAVEVLSFGQSGFGTADEYMRYQNFGASYSPDMVIVAVTLSNDIRNNSKALNLSSLGYYFSQGPDGSLVLDSSVMDAYQREAGLWRRTFQAVKQHSYLASLISERLYLLRKSRSDAAQKASANSGVADEGSLGGGVDATGGVGGDGGSGGGAGARGGGAGKDDRNGQRGDGGRRMDTFADENIYRPDLPSQWKQAFEITKQILGMFRDAALGRKSAFLIVLIPSAEEVNTELDGPLRRAYGDELDFDQPNRLLEGYARELGIPCVNLLPSFRERRAKIGDSLYGFKSSLGGHWNERGHAYAAQLVADQLVGGGLFPSAGSSSVGASPPEASARQREALTSSREPGRAGGSPE